MPNSNSSIWIIIATPDFDVPSVFGAFPTKDEAETSLNRLTSTNHPSWTFSTHEIPFDREGFIIPPTEADYTVFGV